MNNPSPPFISPDNPVFRRKPCSVFYPFIQVRPRLPFIKAVMKEHKLFALAAPQIGIAYSFFVINDVEFINPRLLSSGAPLVDRVETCPNFPGIESKHKRYMTFKIMWKDAFDRRYEHQFHGPLAFVIQQMMDRIDARPFLSVPANIIPFPSTDEIDEDLLSEEQWKARREIERRCSQPHLGNN